MEELTTLSHTTDDTQLPRRSERPRPGTVARRRPAPYRGGEVLGLELDADVRVAEWRPVSDSAICLVKGNLARVTSARCRSNGSTSARRASHSSVQTSSKASLGSRGNSLEESP